MRISDWSSDVCSSDLDKLKDPRALPLHISVDAFVNETSTWADYIVPDTITYESWGIGAPWADVIARSSTVRWPTVEPAVARTANDETICLETFLIHTALRLEMPGFGKGVIKDSDGNAHDLMNAEDFYLRGLARSEEHTSELPSLMRNSYAVF